MESPSRRGQQVTQVDRTAWAAAERRVRSSGMPHEDYADPITNDGPGFHSDMPVSELTEHVTRAIEASDVSSTPLVAKTLDRTPPMCGGSRKV